MIIATTTRRAARYEFRLLPPEGSEDARDPVADHAVALYQLRGESGGRLEGPARLGIALGVAPGEEADACRNLAAHHIGGGTIAWHFTGDDVWAAGAFTGVPTGPREDVDRSLSDPPTIEAIDVEDMLAQERPIPEGARVVRTRRPATTTVTISRDQLLDAAWRVQARRLAETGEPGSVQFVECVKVWLAGEYWDTIREDFPETLVRAVAQACLVPHLAVAGSPAEVADRAAGYVEWACGEVVPRPAWWPAAHDPAALAVAGE